MVLIKLNKGVRSSTDLLKAVLYIYCYMEGIRLSDSELTTISYIINFGMRNETMDLILKSGILNEGSLKNALSKLRKHGFLQRVNKNDVLNEKFKLKFEGEVALLLKIVNEEHRLHN